MQKSIGEKVLGWFIVEETDEAANEEERTAVKATKAPASAAPTASSGAPTSSLAPVPPSNVAPPALGAGPPGNAAGPSRGHLAAVPSLADEDRDRLGRVLTLLDRLPPEATPEMKRALVAASLDAFGVRVDAILGSTQRAITALDAFSEATRTKTSTALAEADARIERLNREILEIQRAASAQRAANEETLRQASVERTRLQAALSFLQRS